MGLAILVAVFAQFFFVQSFKKEWYQISDEKIELSAKKYEHLPSERSDSGYNTPGKCKKEKSIVKEPKLNNELVKLAQKDDKKAESNQKIPVSKNLENMT